MLKILKKNIKVIFLSLLFTLLLFYVFFHYIYNVKKNPMDDYKVRIDFAKQLIKKQGFDKTKDLAKKMGLLPNTLTSNLKYIIKNERYETAFATRLFHSLGVTKDEFIVVISQKQNKTIESSLSIIQNRSTLLNDIANSYQAEITKLIGNLKNGDTYTLVTTEQPWEFKSFFIRDVILKALKRGVNFRYIYPKVCEKTKREFMKHEDKVEWQQLYGLHKGFLEQMLENSKKDEEFLSINEYAEDPKYFIEENLKAWFVDDIMLVHPRLKSMLIETKFKELDKVFAFSEATFGESFINDNNKPNTLWYPLPNNDTILLYSVIEKIIHENETL